MSDFISVQVQSQELTAGSTFEDSFGKIPQDIREKLESILPSIEDQLKGEAGARVHSRTGTYLASLYETTEETDHSVYGIVGDTAFYAPFIESGATIPAHEIDAKNVDALHFNLPGVGDIFRSAVHSPGAKLRAQQIIHGPFDADHDQIEEEIREALAMGNLDFGLGGVDRVALDLLGGTPG